MRIYYVKEGRAVIHLKDEDLELTPGHMYLLPSFVPHSYECDPNFVFYYLFVYRRTENIVDIFDRLKLPYVVKANNACQLLFENYCMLYPQLNLPTLSPSEFDKHPSYYEYAQNYLKMDEYERLQLHGMAEILFSYFMKHSTPLHTIKDERITDLLGFIQQNLNLQLSIEQLADHACMTKGNLIRMFKKVMNDTPLQYILRKKIQIAQSMLLETDKSVKDIGCYLGFNDPSYFIRIFKRQIGFTPQEYRDNLIG